MKKFIPFFTQLGLLIMVFVDPSNCKFYIFAMFIILIHYTEIKNFFIKNF